MKTITFFTEKGGMGKTTLSAMFASWLRYKMGVNVMVFDFDYPQHRLYSFREEDESALKSSGKFVEMCRANVPYNIGKVKEPTTESGIEKILNTVKTKIGKEDGVCIFDFPGHFKSNDIAFRFAYGGLVDLMVLLADSDKQSQNSALFVYSTLNTPDFKATTGKPNGQDAVLVWNREAESERKHDRDWYAESETLFRAIGLEISPIRVRDALIFRREPPTFGFVRSTMCWPENNVRLRCPSVEDLFEYVYQKLMSI